MVRYVCALCNYKFDREHFDNKMQCPYCGKKGAVKREASASEILDEIGNLEE
jgi:DNA-directed RNA polymerase subunit RPC12/RpoP